MDRRDLLMIAATLPAVWPCRGTYAQEAAAISHGSDLTAPMTGHTALGVAQDELQVMRVPGRGYWRGDTAAEFSQPTPYVYNDDPANKGGVVPTSGLLIDGHRIPGGTRVIQFRDFSAGNFYLTSGTSFLWRGCRFRGRNSAPGYFNCQRGQTGRLYFFYNDMGGLGSAANQFNEVPVGIAHATSVVAYRNRVSFTTTAFQANIEGPVRIVENYISDLTAFGTDSHLNGITHNGGENHSWILRNHIVIRTPDTSGRAVAQTDCVSFFQDFGDFAGAGVKRIDSNYLGGTGYCIYAGMNAGKPATSVRNMVVANNLVTTREYPLGGRWGPITATPPWGVNGNVLRNNRWADGPNEGGLW